MSRYAVASLRAPRRVRLQVDNGAAGSYEFAPLAAAHLAGLLFAAAIELIDSSKNVGVFPRDFSPVTVWTMETIWANQDSGSASWEPHQFTTTGSLKGFVHSLQQEGIPYRVTIDLFRDALEPQAKP